jgi:hypothetical protein
MGQVNTNLNLQGFEEPVLGVIGVEGFDNPITSLEPHVNKKLPAQGTYDPASQKLTLTVSGTRPTLNMTITLSEIGPDMSQHLRTIANGGTVNVTFNSVYPSIVGMHIEPVVQ